MMTSIAFILGLVPLVIATGAAMLSRRAVGTPVFGGMLAASLFGIFMIPMLYVVFQGMREWVKGRFRGKPRPGHPPNHPRATPRRTSPRNSPAPGRSRPECPISGRAGASPPSRPPHPPQMMGQTFDRRSPWPSSD